MAKRQPIVEKDKKQMEDLQCDKEEP